MEEMHTNDSNEGASGPVDGSDSGEQNPQEENASTTAGQTGESIEEQIAALQSEADEYKDKFMRAVAENENIRRRYEKEKSDLLNYGLEKFMNDILPVLDSIDKAIPVDSLKDQSTAAESGSLIEGVKLMDRLLRETLIKHGLEVVADEGEVFNPEFHQAIQRIESPEVDKDMVQQVFQKGYCLRGRLIRPSMVSVAVPQSEA